MKHSSFQLKRQPNIKSLKFDLVENNIDIDNIDNQTVDIHISKEILYSKEKQHAIIELKIELKNENVFNLEAIIKAEFLWEENTSEHDIMAFLEISSPALMLSYIRPIISNITTYSGLAPYIIPLLDLRDTKKNKNI